LIASTSTAVLSALWAALAFVFECFKSQFSAKLIECQKIGLLGYTLDLQIPNDWPTYAKCKWERQSERFVNLH
jgi:hypothetical protein